MGVRTLRADEKWLLIAQPITVQYSDEAYICLLSSPFKFLNPQGWLMQEPNTKLIFFFVKSRHLLAM